MPSGMSFAERAARVRRIVSLTTAIERAQRLRDDLRRELFGDAEARLAKVEAHAAELAAENERLRAEVERLRAALLRLADVRVLRSTCAEGDAWRAHVHADDWREAHARAMAVLKGGE